MTPLAWILLGELVLVVLLTFSVAALAARHRRRTTLDALHVLLDRLRLGEADRLAELRRRIAQHPAVFGADSAATAERWLNSEKDFIRTLLSVSLAGDIDAISRLDESLKLMLDGRLPPEGLPAAENVAAPDTDAPPVAEEAEAPAEASTLEDDPALDPEDGESPAIPDVPVARTEADLWSEMAALAQAVADTPVVTTELDPLEPVDGEAADVLEQAFWADMGLSDAPLAAEIAPDLEPVPGIAVGSERKDAEGGDEKQALREQAEPPVVADPLTDGPDDAGAMPGSARAGATAPSASPEDAAVLDVDVWEELQALTQGVRVPSAPGAEQQDESGTAEETAQE
ncbi:hypothetical protein [Methylococcus sp. EFPC2]|uniref:hypothetical protein n=1 Tax=Methylococcus sp. EFPC2 TaxID=2812648 RepID=UPI001967C23A|nr:hypothetical protein [Methylococcus sp. EFPC2]QSA96335.1 hypothetical protein JWZ97_14045 [Methylococcus sp. EFPC2]